MANLKYPAQQIDFLARHHAFSEEVFQPHMAGLLLSSFWELRLVFSGNPDGEPWKSHPFLTDPPRNTGDLLALSTKKTFIALVQGKIDKVKLAW